MFILCGRAGFLPPKKWTSILLPYKVIIQVAISVFCGLNRRGLIAGLAVTKGGQIKLNVWNTTDEAIHLTPKTVLVNLMGARVEVKKIGMTDTIRVSNVLIEEDMGEKIKRIIKENSLGWEI